MDGSEWKDAYNEWQGGGMTTENDVIAKMNQWNTPWNRRVTYIIELDKNPQYTGLFNPIDGQVAHATKELKILFIDKILQSDEHNSLSTVNPGVWEVEQKPQDNIDIYYEASKQIPIYLNSETQNMLAPVGSMVRCPNNKTALQDNTKIASWNNNVVSLDKFANNVSDLIANQDVLYFETADGGFVSSTIQDALDINPADEANQLVLSPSTISESIGLDWFNCFSFGNGVESAYLRDDYNAINVSKGAKASTTIDKLYEEEHRKSGLIYSGLYNSTSGINNLNQFVAAEKITKDINPIYGGIQKLHARDTDLITLCEDKCLKILANKDAVFNADGNTQLTSTNNVLGQAVPFVGEFGISKNPESFAAEKYRVYFTDKQRGAVMRLSKDGLTAISDHGMTDWFRDNLRLGSRLIGSFDSEKNEYNLTIRGDSIDKTLSFKEDVRGWVSFKSFILDGGMSLANDYYTFKDGAMWKHHQAVYDDPLNPNEATNHNTFYGSHVPSWFNVILNDVPGSIKSFNTINYEGSQSRIRIPKDENNLPVDDGEYHNLSDKEGWYVDYTPEFPQI